MSRLHRLQDRSMPRLRTWGAGLGGRDTLRRPDQLLRFCPVHAMQKVQAVH